MDGLRGLFDNWERKKIIRRLKDGRDTKIKRGPLWRGPRPYGWLYRTAAMMRVICDDPHRKDGELVHHPDEAPIVREIITRIATGEMTAHSMAGDLNRRDLLVPSIAMLLARWNWWPARLSRPAADQMPAAPPGLATGQVVGPTQSPTAGGTP